MSLESFGCLMVYQAIVTASAAERHFASLVIVFYFKEIHVKEGGIMSQRREAGNMCLVESISSRIITASNETCPESQLHFYKNIIIQQQCI